MNSSKYIFTLDLRSVQSQITLPVTKGDTNRKLVVSFSDGAKPYILEENSTVMMSIVRPTGTQVQEFCEVEEGGACVIYNFSEHTCIVPGLHKCQLVLYDAEGRQIASPKFGIDAAPKLVDEDGVVIPDDDLTSLNAIYIAEGQRQAAEAAREENTKAAIEGINEVKNSIETMRDNGELEGESAYEIAVKHGYKGTEEQWEKEVRGDFSERVEKAKEEVAAAVIDTNDEYLKHIDEIIGDGSESIGLIIPEKAEVGQFLKVTSVTDNGKVAALEAISISAPIPLTQEEYDALVAAGTVEKDALYMIIEEDSV